MLRRSRKALLGHRIAGRASEPNGAFLWIYDDVRVLCFIVRVTKRRKAKADKGRRSQKNEIYSQAQISVMMIVLHACPMAMKTWTCVYECLMSIPSWTLIQDATRS